MFPKRTRNIARDVELKASGVEALAGCGGGACKNEGENSEQKGNELA